VGGSASLAARIAFDDWGILVVFAIVMLVRAVAAIRKKMKELPAPRREPEVETAPPEDEDDDPDDLPPWARPAPVPRAPAPTPAPRRRQEARGARAERAPRTIATIEHLASTHEHLADLGSTRLRTVEHLGARPSAAAVVAFRGRTAAASALLAPGANATPTERLRSAVAWAEILRPPRALRRARRR
jgi:hypothetical protein